MKNRKALSLIKTAYLSDQLIQVQFPCVLFLGRSNAGKSSLINALSSQGLAQVSKSPGKTRSINFYRWGKKMYWVDLPGYGFAKRSKSERNDWREIARSFFDELPGETLSFLLMDSRRDLGAEEFELSKSLLSRGSQVVILLTKADQLSQSDRHHRQEQMKENLLNYQFTSAKTGEGIRWIHQALSHYEKNLSLPVNEEEGLASGPRN